MQRERARERQLKVEVVDPPFYRSTLQVGCSTSRTIAPPRSPALRPHQAQRTNSIPDFQMCKNPCRLVTALCPPQPTWKIACPSSKNFYISQPLGLREREDFVLGMLEILAFLIHLTSWISTTAITRSPVWINACHWLLPWALTSFMVKRTVQLLLLAQMVLAPTVVPICTWIATSPIF